MSNDFEVLPVGTAARLAAAEAERDALREKLSQLEQSADAEAALADRLRAELKEADDAHAGAVAHYRREQQKVATLQAERDALLCALSALGIRPMPNQQGRWLSKHRPGLNFPSAEAAAIDAAKGGGNG